jgi:serine/threonine-protein kinase
MPHSTEVRTIVFTDIVGSTRLKQSLGDREGVALIERHHVLLRSVLEDFSDGVEISNSGDGFLLLFTRPSEAVSFGLRLQSALRAFNRDESHKVEDRVGIHAGEVVMEKGVDGTTLLQGIQIDTASRITSLAGSDQILLSRFAFDNARQMLHLSDVSGLEELSWISHGHYEVDGVEEPIEVCEVGERRGARLTAPTESAKARRRTQSDGTLVLGWRPAAGENVPATGWKLERKLGEGGFGEVWLAEHTQLRQRRVFKFCFFADRARSLRREVTLFRLLAERVRDHPNIVRVGDVFLDSPPYYLSMEYVPGEDLIHWSEAVGGLQTVNEECKLKIVMQVADALSAAHSAGVLHRDVKPSNVLIDTEADGDIQAKLTDFGIGQVVSQEVLCGLTGLGFTATVGGPESASASGTRLYMAPELLAGKAASPQSDIYSLGVVLYQLLVADLTRPLTMDWSRQVADPLLRDDLHRCFAGDPAERFASAAELAANLRALHDRRLERVEFEAAALRREKVAYRRGVYRTAIAAGAVVAVVLAVAATAIFFAREARQHNARNEVILDFMLQDLRTKLEPSGRREVLLTVVERVLQNQRDLNVGWSATTRGRVREANALILRGDIELYRGEPMKAKSDYQAASDILDQVLKKEEHQMTARRLRAGLDYKLGDVAAMLGQTEQGALLAERSRNAFEPLLAELERETFTNNGGKATTATELQNRTFEAAQLRRDAAMALWKAASFRPEQEREPLFRMALELREAAARELPDQVQWRFEVAQAWLSLAIAARWREDLAAAESAIAKSKETALTLLQEYPGNANWKHLLARVALERAQEQSSWAAIRDALTEAIGILQEIRVVDPANAWWQWDLAEAHTTFAAKLELADQGQLANGHRAEAVRLRRSLAEAHPDVAIWKEISNQEVENANYSGTPPLATTTAAERPDGERPAVATATPEQETADSAAERLIADAQQYYPRDLSNARMRAEEALREVPDYPAATALLGDIAVQEKKENDFAVALQEARAALDRGDTDATERALANVPADFAGRESVLSARESIAIQKAVIANERDGKPAKPRTAVGKPTVKPYRQSVDNQRPPTTVSSPRPPPALRPSVSDIRRHQSAPFQGGPPGG